MAVKKVANGWKVDIRPEGVYGKRIRKTFPTKRQAEQWQIDQKAKANAGEWSPPNKDRRKLSDLVNTWYDLHGHTLKDCDNRLRSLTALVNRLGDPIAKNFTGEDFLEYRRFRLTQKHEHRDKLVEPNTVNHEHAYLFAVFSKLIKIKNWKLDNPLKGLSKLTIDEPALVYLEQDEIRALLASLKESKNPNVLVISKICLSTGARWGEAESLQAQQVKQGKIHFIKTKNSKSRAVPISDELSKEIIAGRPRFGRLFPGTSKQAFRLAVERSGINLPDGQMTHVLRHTFASHYMINDGNILKLKDILGHKTLSMTIRYAKLAPKHLADAVTRNPLATL
ncbi:Integrase [Hahella chejuensis KCTC 2396]|uniref:Integrase n=1 Tax=Hahella chejuensis (strain KCTC 2396) TaxID=349521 RepID=Q2SPV8_HAHCH|nr:tyrosine-type recombinase/integrase [Hahella chejuensis]ABC27316.1 Integrase [Hahella chejuensis KCTC 2396]